MGHSPTFHTPLQQASADCHCMLTGESMISSNMTISAFYRTQKLRFNVPQIYLYLIIRNKIGLPPVIGKPHISTELSLETHTEEDTSDKPHISTELSQETHTEEDTSDKPHISTELSQETHTEEDTSDKVASSLLWKGNLVLKIIIFCRSV